VSVVHIDDRPSGAGPLSLNLVKQVLSHSGKLNRQRSDAVRAP